MIATRGMARSPAVDDLPACYEFKRGRATIRRPLHLCRQASWGVRHEPSATRMTQPCPKRRPDGHVSDAREYLEKARLPPGDLNLWTVAQLRMEPTIDARLDSFDEPQIND